MFTPLDPHPDFAKQEEEILKFWQRENIFQKSLANRKGAPKFIFYDGPPFANGLPHYGHILTMTIKDVVCRYKTADGFFVPRRGGWDTHGLPVEYEVEKELGISGKKEIESFGVEKFNQRAKNSVMRYAKEWIKTMERMGRWIDWQNAYTTMDSNYIESVWWVFKTLYQKGLIYQGYKSLPYCPRCGTPLSNFEVNQGYKDNVKDPSIVVKFKILTLPHQDSFLLAWTTTPWTLPANTALAIGKKIDYLKVQVAKEKYIIAKKRLSLIKGDYKIISHINPKDLIGLKYQPLYSLDRLVLQNQNQNKKIYQVVAADFVSVQEGTGIVHIAPAFGEDDLELSQKENLALIKTIDENGYILASLNLPGKNKFVKQADDDILADLANRQLLFENSYTYHTYPFCWRCESPLIYYAMETWFFKVSKIRQELLEQNRLINWKPEYLKHGRFGKWLAHARDWAISRNRYWGAPIPVWQCQGKDKSHCRNIKVIGSLKELREFSLQPIKSENIDLHKPFIDKITFKCENCGGQMSRVPEVLDCWFESGSMPYGQQHYPFENKQEFKNNFPADFIAEGLDQTRGWFYTLHVLATILFRKPAFKNVIVNGIVLSSGGKKLSKRLKNYDEPEKLFSGPGVDALRFFLISSSPLGEDYRFSTEAVKLEVRKVLLPLWNSLSFLITYAEIDKWRPKDLSIPKPKKVLNQWLLSRLFQTNLRVKKYLDAYDLTRASRGIETFIVDLSQWYLRRSRAERNPEFYSTLYFSLKNLAIIIAPFMPFIAEQIYQNLRQTQEPISVHLCDWPKSGKMNNFILEKMAQVRQFAEEGHCQRAQNKIRLRQPLAKITIPIELDDNFKNILKDELNVMEVISGREIKLDTQITPKLKEQGILRDLVRSIQDLRKTAGLKPGEKVDLYFLEKADLIKKHQAEIEDITLVNIFYQPVELKYKTEYIFDSHTIVFGLIK